jgi:hypothetical protein
LYFELGVGGCNYDASTGEQFGRSSHVDGSISCLKDVNPLTYDQRIALLYKVLQVRRRGKENHDFIYS